LTAAQSEWTVVIFEAPNRVAQLLADLVEVCGSETVGSRLSRIDEGVRGNTCGTLQELSEHYAEAPARGEVTVVLSGTGKQHVEEPLPDPGARAKALLAEGCRGKMWLIDLQKKLGSRGMRRIGWSANSEATMERWKVGMTLLMSVVPSFHHSIILLPLDNR